jgi:hypothetical protein
MLSRRKKTIERARARHRRVAKDARGAAETHDGVPDARQASNGSHFIWLKRLKKAERAVAAEALTEPPGTECS